MWSAKDEDSGITPEEYDADHAIGTGKFEPILTPEEINKYLEEKTKALGKLIEMMFNGYIRT